MKSIRNICSVVFLIAFFSDITFAEESERFNRNNSEWGLEVSVGYEYRESPLQERYSGGAFAFSGYYQWKKLFVELDNRWSGVESLPSIGYNFIANNRYRLDLLSAVTYGDVVFNYEINGEQRRVFRERSIGTGFRYIRFWDATNLQVQWFPYFNEEFGGDSFAPYFSTMLSHRVQIGNWSISGLLGARYLSSGFMNHYNGISSEESDPVLNAYKPSSGIDYTAQVKLAYPIAKHWLFETSFGERYYSNAFTESPIIERITESERRPEKDTIFNIYIKYVF